MNKQMSGIEELDISVFKAVRSYTTAGDRSSLLAVQKAISRIHSEYEYLEIGSYLGGTIQPYLADDRCKRIYAIDPRPAQHSDDRSPGKVEHYETITSERMLGLLANTGLGSVNKIECIELDASEIEPNRIMGSVRIAFIDGEHTKTAVLSDFQFCNQIISKDGVILFHDFFIIYPAILKICDQLSKENRIFFPVKLEDNVFAIFFDENVLTTDSYLSSIYKRNRHFLFSFRVKMCLRQYLLGPLLSLARCARSILRKTSV